MKLEIALQPKTDRNGQQYYFAPLRLLNCVLFVYVGGQRFGRPTLVIRPFDGGGAPPEPPGVDGDEGDEHGAPWRAPRRP